ncbi:MAG: Rab5-interacting family protein, partial [Phycisphaerales bacterium]|nr:Rab5-interacting family protein [Phycisphaerales bacterium]
MLESRPTAPATDATTPPDRADMLRAFLAAQDIECPSCRYNVRGLRTDVCPECNQKLTLRLALTEPRLAGFIAGLVGLTSGLGFHTVLAAFFTYYYVFVRLRGGP